MEAQGYCYGQERGDRRPTPVTHQTLNLRPSAAVRGGRAISAFTLLELLTVAVVLGTLAALLLPVLSRAKTQARRIQCLNQEKQIALAWTIYSSDNDERLVLNGAGKPRATGPYLWVQGDNHSWLEGFTDPVYLVNPEFALFAPYIKSAQIYKCPSDQATIEVNLKSVPTTRSYALNLYMGTLQKNSDGPALLMPGFKVYMKSSQLAADSPAARFAFMEVNSGSICTPALGVEMRRDVYVHYPSVVHGGLSVVSFADSHAEARKWVDPRTRQTGPTWGAHLSHSVLAPNNQDLAWIRERTTSKE